MATVQTVTGPIGASQLGVTLVHEHIKISYPGDHLDPKYAFDRQACIDTALERMAGLQEHGVTTWVDPCPIDLGRDPELMAEVSAQSGMQVVCATGFYNEHMGIPWYWRVRSAEEVAEFYMHEVENGIGETGIRPGIIKIASSNPPGEHDRKVIAGAAIAARESGLTVVSHCERAQGGALQQDILAEHGVDLSRCLIGHQGEAPGPEQHASIARRGSFVGFDRIGIEVLASDDQHVTYIKAMVDAGYTDRVCLSQDHMCCLCSPRFPYPVPAGMEELYEQLLPTVYEQMYGRPHTYLFTEFLPKLEAAGISRTTVDTMLTDNPRRLFGG